MNAVVEAIDAGHVFHQGGREDDKSPCKLDGEKWPCAAIREARESVKRKYGALRPARPKL